MSGGDTAVVLRTCPLFTGRHSTGRARAQWAYSENHLYGAGRGFMYYRQRDVEHVFFRLSDDCTFLAMGPGTEDVDCASVYCGIQLLFSLLQGSPPAVLEAICSSVFSIRHVCEHLLVGRDALAARVRAVKAQTTVEELRLGIVFGWLLALVAIKTAYAHVVVDLFVSAE